MASIERVAFHDNLAMQDEGHKMAQYIRSKRGSSAVLLFIDLIRRLGNADQQGQAQLEAEIDYLTAQVKRAINEHGRSDWLEDIDLEQLDRTKAH